MIARIISGGQTGVDRAALDVALELKLPYSGWTPPGRKTEAGELPARYVLGEVTPQMFKERGLDPNDPADGYRCRTMENVTDADAVLILERDPNTRGPGTWLTIRTARDQNKPCMVVYVQDPDAPWRIQRWIQDQNIRILMVAGSRASRDPEIYSDAVELLKQALGPE